MRYLEKSDVDEMRKDYKLQKGQSLTVTIDGSTPNSCPIPSFDGYADVYQCTVYVHSRSGKILRKYSATMGHEALCYFYNGE